MMKEKIIDILIADDHPALRSGVREIVEREGRYRVVAQAGDGEEAFRLIRELRPSAAILDIEMPKLDGLEVARRVQEEKLSVPILILTVYQEDSIFNRAMEYGVTGYLLKDSVASDIVKGLGAVLKGEYFVSPALAHRVVSRTYHHNQIKDVAGSLSPTERRILDLIAESKSTRQIADALFISHRTVENHRANICRKLGLTGAYSLMRFALTQWGGIQ